MIKLVIPNLGWELINGENRHAENPEKFNLPPVEQRENLGVGKFVKIGVENPTFNDHRRINGERFWVEITRPAKHQGCYHGKIANDLVLSDVHGLSCDNIIAFTAANILSTELPPPGAQPPPAGPAVEAFRNRLRSRLN